MHWRPVLDVGLINYVLAEARTLHGTDFSRAREARLGSWHEKSCPSWNELSGRNTHHILPAAWTYDLTRLRCQNVSATAIVAVAYWPVVRLLVPAEGFAPLAELAWAAAA